MSSVKFGSGLFEKAFTRGFAVAVFLSVLSAGIAHATPEIAVTGNGSNIISDPFGSSPSVSRDTDFGQVSVAGVTDTHTFTITNSGTTPLILSGSPRVSLSGTHVSDYTLVSDAASTVAANGGTTTFSIRFDPSAQGDRFATVTIANNDGNENPFSFSLTGEGTTPEIQVSGGGVLNSDFVIADGDTIPSTADHTDFGVTDVSAGQARRTFTITNFGEEALLLPSGAILSGSHAADFTVVSQPAASVSGGGFSSTTVTVEFNPSATGLRTATLTIPNNDADESPFDFALQGTGSIMAPEISVTGNGVDVVFSTGNSGLTTANGTDFGTVANNGTIVDRTFVIANTGTAPLNLGANAVSIFGLSAVFSVAVQPASVVAPGQTTSFTLRFTSQQGIYGTNAIIANDDGDESPYYFAISAMGAASLPEINVTGDGEGNGNDQDIVDGDTSPSLSDGTDFGTIFVGGSAESRIFTIHNTGTAPLNIGSAVLSGADAGLFSIVLTPSGTVAAGDTTLVAVQLTPTTDGVKTATLTINSDDGDEAAYDFVLTGTGAGGPDIDVTGNGNTITSGDVTPSVSDNTDFGNLAVGASPVDLSFMIQNKGLLILNLGADAVTISGPDASDFSVLTQPPTTINNVNSGDTQPFVLRFNPSSAGVKNATVSIASNDFDENPFTFAMRGTATGAPEMNVLRGSTNIPDDPANDPSAISSTNFGVGFPGAATKIYTIENTGTGPLTLGANAVSVSGTDATRFSVPMQPATTVAAGGTTTFQIRFTPDAARLFGPTDIAIANDDADENPYNFRIQGRGLGVEMNVTGNSQAISDNAAHTPSAGDHTDFGSADIASGAVTRTFTIENSGFGFFLDLQSASAVSISGAHASDFTVTRHPPQLVDVGVPETFDITFNPSAAGLRGPVDVVISNDDDDENPYNFRLQGTGTADPEINVTGGGQTITDGDTSPTSADLTDVGSRTASVGSLDVVYTIENTGSGPLTLGANAASLSGTHAADFSIVAQPATSVAPSGSTTVRVRFAPTAVGVRTAMLTIANDDGDESPYNFAIQGAGSGVPEINFLGNGQSIVDGDTTPSASDHTDFGTVDLATGLISRTFTIQNLGNDILNLPIPASLSGANAGDFTITGQPATTVAAAGSTTLTVQFDPSALGTRTATLSLDSDDADEGTYDFVLQGTGANLDLTPPRVASIDQLFRTSPTDVDEVIWRILFDEAVDNLTLDDFTVSGTTAALSVRTPPTNNPGFGTLIDLRLSGGDLAGLNGVVTLSFAGSQDIADTSGNALANLTPTGLNESSVTIINNQPDIRITGDGPNPPSVLSGPDLVNGQTATSAAGGTDFGSQALNTASNLFTFSLNNTSPFSTLVTGNNALTFSGPAAGDFSVVGASNRTLGGNGTTGFTIQFTPSAVGPRNAAVTLVSNDPDENPFTFNITGTGIGAAEIDVTGNSVSIADGDTSPNTSDHTDFGSADISSGTVSRTFAIENTGMSLLTLGTNAASLSGVNVGDFLIVTQPATTVSPAGSTNVTVQFNPAALGVRSATLTIANDDGDESPYNFTVSGTGSGAPEINVVGNGLGIADGDTTPAEADHTTFGASDVTSGAVSRVFTIQNTGTDVLNLGANAASLSGTHASDFSVSAQPATSLAPGGSTSVTVQFDPSALGARTAVLTIANDDADENPYDFALAGQGISGGTLTIVQNVTGEDVSVGFSSTTPALNFSLTSVSGTAQTSLAGVPVGMHTLVAEDLTPIGYGVSSIACDDADSTGDVVNRTATINLLSGEHVTCVFETIDTRGPTTQMIADFLGARNTLLLGNQPDSERRINRLKGGSGVSGGDSFQAFGHNLRSPLPVDVSVSEDSFSFATSLKRVLAAGGEASLASNGNEKEEDATPLDIWIEGSASRFIGGTSGGGSFGLLSFGVDYVVEPDLLIGFMGQIDRFKQDFVTPGSETDGRGWMAGPYATLKLDEHLYLDVLGAWGRSDNEISPFGTYTDSFETDRWLVSSTLTGQFDVGNWDLRPSYSLQFLHERQFAYTDSLGVRIPEQSLSQGDMRLGPQIAYTYTFEDGAQLRPEGGFEGIYSFGERNTFSPGSLAAETQGLTGQVNGGLDYQTPGGLSLGLSADYGGIGGTAKSFGLTINLSMPLN